MLVLVSYIVIKKLSLEFKPSGVVEWNAGWKYLIFSLNESKKTKGLSFNLSKYNVSL
jgi:hypothetical protein